MDRYRIHDNLKKGSMYFLIFLMIFIVTWFARLAIPHIAITTREIKSPSTQVESGRRVLVSFWKGDDNHVVVMVDDPKVNILVPNNYVEYAGISLVMAYILPVLYWTILIIAIILLFLSCLYGLVLICLIGKDLFADWKGFLKKN